MKIIFIVIFSLLVGFAFSDACVVNHYWNGASCLPLYQNKTMFIVEYKLADDSAVPSA